MPFMYCHDFLNPGLPYSVSVELIFCQSFGKFRVGFCKRVEKFRRVEVEI